MSKDQHTYDELIAQIEQLKEQYKALELTLLVANNHLEEATDTLEAIRTGEIDALVINGLDGHQIYTLKSADHTYRIFIEQMTQGAITISRDGMILYSNSQFANLVAKPLERVIGQTLTSFVVQKDKELCRELIESAWENILTNGELRLANTEGADVPVLLSLKTLELDEGTSLSIIVTDLSGQKQNEKLLKEKNELLHKAERLASQLNVNLEATVKRRTRDLEKSILEKTKIAEQLYKSQQQLSKILETMAEGVQIIDTEGRLIYANKMAQQLLGIENFDIIKGKYDEPDWAKFKLDGSALMPDEHPIQIAMSAGKAIFDYEIAIKPPHKEVFYISMNAVPIYDENKQLTGGIGTFMDVTHRRKAIQQKDDFISVASHELKTPITSLKAAIQLLDRIKDGQANGMSKLIEQATRSMSKVNSLVEELLNASKLTSGQMHIKLVPFRLNEVVHESYQHIPITDKVKIRFEGNFEQQVLGDPIRIEQVLVNFINNALKYAPDSELIQINVQEEDGFAKIAVKDNGPGIEPQKLPHIFERYYRVDDRGQQYSGLGLGLYIAAEIIKKHGGKIGADSALGKGSTFWFTLPLVDI